MKLRPGTIEVYKDLAGEWRWRCVAHNGEVAVPGESHRDKTDAERAAKRARSLMRLAPIKTVEK